MIQEAELQKATLVLRFIQEKSQSTVERHAFLKQFLQGFTM
jgi:hypothetical protein